MDADFLLTRGSDLVVIGVRLRGFAPGPPPPAGAAPVLVADSEDSRIVLYLPPQHLAEQTTATTPADDFRAQAELAGPSRVAYSVDLGTPISLDAEGVLAACTALAALASPPGSFDTAVELPFRLVLSPTSTDGLPLVVEQASTPLRSGESVVGLWLTRIQPSGSRSGTPSPAAGTAMPPELDLVPVDTTLANTPDPGFAVPLTTNSRNLIVAMGAGRPPRGRRVELTALGGSLDAHGVWPGFRWSHRATLGRDQEVVVQEEGRLYPFGPRAIFTTTVVRDPDAVAPDGSTVRPGGTLGLRLVHELEILEPIMAAADGLAFGREFPFSSVEVATTTFRGIGPGQVAYAHTRPSALTDLETARDGLVAEAAALAELWGPEAALPRTVQDLVNRGFEPAIRWQNLVAQIAPLTEEHALLEPQVTQLNALSTQLDEAQRNLDALVASTPATEDGSVSPEIAAAQAEVTSISQSIQALGFVDFNRFSVVSAELDRLGPLAEAAFAELEPQLALPRSVEDLVAAGNQAAIDWVAKQAEIVGVQAQIDLLAGVDTTVEVFLWPTTAEGARLTFPVRLTRGSQVIDVTMPLIFVKDFVLPAVGSMPEYASMLDPELAQRLDRAWKPDQPFADEDGVGPAAGSLGAGVVAAHGVLLDVVGASIPKPEDTQVVHALNILGGLADPFVPGLGRAAGAGRAAQWAMQVDLPAVRTLLGEASGNGGAPSVPTIPGVPNVATALGATRVSFAADYLGSGEAAEVLFDVVDELGVDFTKMADRSGGLAAIELAADGISRELGPVQVGGLTSGDPAQMIGSAATLLGFKLQDLVKSLPGPPTIVSELLDGQQPVVRMEWKDVELKDVLALRAYPNDDHPDRKSSLSLEVVSTLGKVTTSCVVTEFALVFPPAGSPLVRLDFAELSYRQETTPQRAAPPKVDVKGFDIQFLGPLQLLETLRKAADLIGSVPGITATPAGVTARFSLPIPAVRCGAFSLSNVVFHSAVEVPFGGDPVAVSIGFASRANPFALSVLVFGGGGYLDIRLDANGPRIEASLEFGAMMSVDFVVASGEVHALGGVRYLQEGSSVELTGFVRIGGSVDVLGLVSVSIELVVSLAYDFGRKLLAGRATLVLEIDLTFWSDSIEIDSGEWVLQGGDETVRTIRVRDADGRPFGDRILEDDELVFAGLDAPPTDEELAAWRDYRSAFARRRGDG